MFAQLVPQGPTSKQSHRVINFCKVRIEIVPLFSAIELVHKVPWGPRYGLRLDIAAGPLAIKYLEHFPRDLPLIEFDKEWDTLNEFVKLGFGWTARTTTQ